MKKKYLMLWMILFLVCIGIGSVLVMNKHNSGTDQKNEMHKKIWFEIEDAEEQSIISMHKKEDGYYVFLPAYAKLENTYINYEKDYELFLEKKQIEKGTSCDTLSLLEKYEIKLLDKSGKTVLKDKIEFLKSANISTMHLSILDGSLQDIVLDKTVEKKAEMKVVNEDMTINYTGRIASFHGRGNSTWDEAKKPYAIELENDGDILGMGSGKKWVLLANAYDGSLLRNKIVYDMAAEIGMAYTPETRWVDLYIDGEYQGVYLLSEKVEMEHNRIELSDLEKETKNLNNEELKKYASFEKKIDNRIYKGFKIPNLPKDITGGYIVERMIDPGRVSSTENFFSTKNNNMFKVDYPSAVAEAQIDYLGELFQKVENSLEMEEIDEYIDRDSWAKYYLIQELFGNSDEASIFFYKDSDKVDSKLYAGPIWDFDLSMGQCWGEESIRPDAAYFATGGWYNRIVQNKEFNNKITQLYQKEIRDDMEALIENKLDSYCLDIKDAFQCNTVRWKNEIYAEKSGWFDYSEDIDDHIEKIKEYLRSRIQFFDKKWLQGDEIYTVCVYSISPIYSKKFVNVYDGKLEKQIETPSYDGYNFIGWYDEQTGDAFDEKSKITRNMKIVAKWEQTEEGKLAEMSRKDKIAYYLKKNIVIEFTIGFLVIGLGCIVYKKKKERKNRNGNE